MAEPRAAAPEDGQVWGSTTSLVSVVPGATQVDEEPQFFNQDISARGRFVAFSSVVGDDRIEVYVRDRLAGTTELVSVGHDGQPANGDTLYEVAISGNGRLVAFASTATNLVAGDTDDRVLDVFVRDTWRDVTRKLSVGLNGQRPSRDSFEVTLSQDGRFAAFESAAGNLVRRDNNNALDIFVVELATDEITRVSVNSAGEEGSAGSDVPDSRFAALSAQGRYVTFSSEATNLALPRRDRNHSADIFVHDRSTGVTRRVSVSADGTRVDGDSGSPEISADGQHIVFSSIAPNLVRGDTNDSLDVFVRDMQNGTTRRLSVRADRRQGNNSSYAPSISADGRLVSFTSRASNLVSGDANDSADVFVTRVDQGTVRLAGVSDQGDPPNADCWESALSADGRHLLFASEADNLAPNDEDQVIDRFVRDRAADAP